MAALNEADREFVLRLMAVHEDCVLVPSSVLLERAFAAQSPIDPRGSQSQVATGPRPQVAADLVQSQPSKKVGEKRLVKKEQEFAQTSSKQAAKVSPPVSSPSDGAPVLVLSNNSVRAPAPKAVLEVPEGFPDGAALTPKNIDRFNLGLRYERGGWVQPKHFKQISVSKPHHGSYLTLKKSIKDGIKRVTLIKSELSGERRTAALISAAILYVRRCIELQDRFEKTYSVDASPLEGVFTAASAAFDRTKPSTFRPALAALEKYLEEQKMEFFHYPIPPVKVDIGVVDPQDDSDQLSDSFIEDSSSFESSIEDPLVSPSLDSEVSGSS